MLKIKYIWASLKYNAQKYMVIFKICMLKYCKIYRSKCKLLWSYGYNTYMAKHKHISDLLARVLWPKPLPRHVLLLKIADAIFSN